jgi:hypothetical protein
MARKKQLRIQAKNALLINAVWELTLLVIKRKVPLYGGTFYKNSFNCFSAVMVYVGKRLCSTPL